MAPTYFEASEVILGYEKYQKNLQEMLQNKFAKNIAKKLQNIHSAIEVVPTGLAENTVLSNYYVICINEKTKYNTA